jgi:hypothetical protein
VKFDVMIELRYDTETDSFEIRTNAKKERVKEILGEYLRTEIGAGRDDTPLIPRSVYEIKLGLALEDDAWACSHDCGNNGLRTGIVMAACKALQDGRVVWKDLV